MECITVLKNPDLKLKSNSEIFGYEISGENQSGKFSRLCSQRGRTCIFGVMFVFTLISFMSHLLLHSQVEALKQQVELQNQKINELLNAKYIEQHVASEKSESTESKNPESLSDQILSSGRSKRGLQSTPHFYLKGDNGITPGGIFLWKRDPAVSYDGDANFYADFTGDNRIKKIIIKNTGTYYIYSQINVAGRSDYSHRMSDPAVGFTLKKKGAGNHVESLASAYLTQDGRGDVYAARNYPVDTITQTGLYYLRRNDEIFIERRDLQENNNYIQFDNREEHASFGGFLIERKPEPG